MDGRNEYPIICGTEECGNLSTKVIGLYTHCTAIFFAKNEALYSLALEGERGSVVLGVPEWRDGEFFLRRTVANHQLLPLGTLLRARIEPRPCSAEALSSEQGWLCLERAEYFFHRPEPELACCGPCFWRPAEKGRFLALPLRKNSSFLLTRYFCFARIETLWGSPYAIFFFDQTDRPKQIE